MCKDSLFQIIFTTPSKAVVKIANMDEVKHKIIRLMEKNFEK